MHYTRFLFTFVCVLFFLSVSAQKSILKQANRYFKAEKYADALELYNKIDTKNLSKETIFKRGISKYHTNKTEGAILDFTNARRMGYDTKDIYIYAARALHSKKMYADASKFYKNYLIFLEDEKEQREIINMIKQCKFGIDNQFNDQIAFVENLGPIVNTEYDEINPVQSPTSHNKYYFSSNRSGSKGGLRNVQGYKDEIYGKYSSDMYAVELSGGNWTPASAFHPILNGPKHDIIEGFNSDGSVMYFLTTQDRVTGQMFSDTFSIDKDPEAFPKEFSSPVISELGDKDLQVFNNHTLIFSSKRKGGYGGYDLYVSVKEENQWGNPINLGPKINSSFDEISPFLTKGGTKLFYSTNRIESLGGFDVYQIEYSKENQEWNNPINLGFPINSAMDDCHFSVSGDGMTAILSSDRPESIGGSDLYLAYFKEQIMDQLLYTEELPFLNKNDSGLVQENLMDEKQEPNAVAKDPTFKPKDVHLTPLYYGKDEIILNPANRSKMVRVKDLMIIYPELKITFSGHSSKDGLREFDLYFSIKRSEKAAEYLIENGVEPSRITVKGLGSNFPHTLQTGIAVSSLAEKNNKRIDISFSNVPNDKLKVTIEYPTASEGLKNQTFENYKNTISDLSYKIQIAKTKQMYKADVIRQYSTGIIEKNMAEDIYTYTIGVFNSYKNARSLKSELYRKGILNAKIVPYINDHPINNEQVEALKQDYTDLNEYLKFESE